MVSEKQINFVKSLCEQKGIKFHESMIHDNKVVKEVIDKLLAMKSIPKTTPPSDMQIETIRNLCKSLHIEEPDYMSLTGGRGGTASEKIAELIAFSKSPAANNIPISEEQAELLIKMQESPWVTALFGPSGLSDSEIHSMTKIEAREAIAKSLPEYNGWLKERPSEGQMQRVEDLHRIMEIPFDRGYWYLHTKETIKPWIDQLAREANERVWRESTLEPENMYKMHTIDDAPWKNKERIELETLTSGLYAMIGQELEDDFFETMEFDGLKELTGMVKEFTSQQAVEMLFENITVFDANEKDELISGNISLNDVVFEMVTS